jgi:hypothetical protein
MGCSGNKIEDIDRGIIADSKFYNLEIITIEVFSYIIVSAFTL